MPKPKKAYKNLDFLNSREARAVRILCEYEEPKARLEEAGIDNTIVMFGSARIRSEEDARSALESAQAAYGEGTGSKEDVTTAERRLKLARYYEQTVELSRRLTAWSMDRGGTEYHICSGGGPGIMEAANKGASQVPGAQSVGLGISLPFEAGVNEFTPEDLAFEFHYFFMRKLWFLYLAKAVIICPGGFGTLDEFFETLTLIQTGKINRPLPLVLFGAQFWNRVLNLDAMVEEGTISPEDPGLFLMTDSVDEAFDYVVSSLESIEKEGES
jgi:uncharacterized protein (TIGR00730 family)